MSNSNLLKNFSKYTIIILLSIILLQSPIIRFSHYNGHLCLAKSENNEFLKPNNLDEDEPIIGNTLQFNDYVPVNHSTGDGDYLTVEDFLNVNQYAVLDLPYNDSTNLFQDSFYISNISEYNTNSLEYNITRILAKQFNYTIEDEYSEVTQLDADQISVAQSFEVSWDYANFYGAFLNLSYVNEAGNLKISYLELNLVKADDITGKPNMTEILSSDLNGRYNVTQLYSSGFNYFDFGDVILERGKYYIVAQVFDAYTNPSKFFAWGANSGTPYGGDTFFQDGSEIWSTTPEDLDQMLKVHLLPSNETGSALIVADPKTISLKDNSIIIDTLFSPITSTGEHIISANTSIEITFNNSYTFNVYAEASSIFQAYNSSFNEYSILWNVTCQVNQTDISPYSNLNRTLMLTTPRDWNNTFSASYNISTILTGEKVTQGYILYLNDNDNAGDIVISTSSPNYIQNLILSDISSPTLSYNLGYWTTNGTHAIGYEGSTMFADLTVKNSVSTGFVNLTIFNSQAKIVQLKSSLPSNISYLDLTEYSKNNILFTTPGIFESNISFDPSVYGTDLPGTWTAYVFWQNGTEVGIYTCSLNIQALTAFDYEWEVLPDSDIWVNDDTITILRQNGDNLEVNIEFSTISEPFLTGNGKPINNAKVSYNTEWGYTDNLTDLAPLYTASISTAVTAGDYIISFEAEKPFYQSNAFSVDIEIFNVYKLEIQQEIIEINETEEARLVFQLTNTTDINNVTMFPDQIQLQINSNPVSSTFYTISTDGNNTVVTVDITEYGITSGTANVSLVILKDNFRVGYFEELVSFDFEVTVNPGIITTTTEPTTTSTTPTSSTSQTSTITTNDGLPQYAYVIIGFVGLIFLILVSSLLVTSRRAKKQAIPIPDKSNIGKVFESVLSMRKVIFVHNETGLPVFDIDIGAVTQVDTSLISGFLSVVSNMGKEIGGVNVGEIKRLQYKNFTVTGVSVTQFTVYLFSTKEVVEEFEKRLNRAIVWFEDTFDLKDKVWDGEQEIFLEKRKIIQDTVGQALLLWIFFPLKFNTKRVKDIKKFDEKTQKLLRYVKKSKQVTVGDILEKFKTQSLDELLTTIFKLVNKNILIRHKFL